MKLLLDTHTLLWFDTEPETLSKYGYSLIKDRQNEVFVSVISVWELSIKNRLGKLPEATPLLNSYHASISRYGFTELIFTSTHALAERNLSQPHRDPFDRALVAQALSENLTFISQDEHIKAFSEVQVFW